jgi:hypothetical protein
MENGRGPILSEGKKTADSGCGKEEGGKNYLYQQGTNVTFCFPSLIEFTTPILTFPLVCLLPTHLQ